jgi:translation elongation factor P/translation initiation factor 5A
MTASQEINVTDLRPGDIVNINDTIRIVLSVNSTERRNSFRPIEVIWLYDGKVHTFFYQDDFPFKLE